jgi:hypothetical protein
MQNLSKHIIEKYNLSIEEDGSIIVQGNYRDSFIRIEDAEVEETEFTFELQNKKCKISLYKEVVLTHLTIF